MSRGLRKLAGYLEEYGTVEDKVYVGLMLKEAENLWDSMEMYKEAADQEDVAAAQVEAQKIQSNPVSQVLGQFMMKQPPSNLPQLVELLGKKLQQDLESNVQAGYPVTDPLAAENKRLKIIAENLAIKNQIKQMQEQEMQQQQMQQAGPALAAMMGGAGGGQLGAPQGGPPPEALAAMMSAMGGAGGGQEGAPQGGAPAMEAAAAGAQEGAGGEQPPQAM